MLEMPENIAKDEYQAAIWRSVTASGRFSDEDAPNIALLCFWHSVAKAAEDAMSKGKSVKVLDQVGYKQMKARNGRMAILERPHPAVTVLEAGDGGDTSAQRHARAVAQGLCRRPGRAGTPAERRREGARPHV